MYLYLPLNYFSHASTIKFHKQLHVISIFSFFDFCILDIGLLSVCIVEAFNIDVIQSGMYTEMMVNPIAHAPLQTTCTPTYTQPAKPLCKQVACSLQALSLVLAVKLEPIVGGSKTILMYKHFEKFMYD